jgi:copper chaperone
MNNKETLLDVEGMSCPSCIRHVNAALADIEGVVKVEVRLREGKVLVWHDTAAANVNILIEALREAGYDSTVSAAA